MTTNRAAPPLRGRPGTLADALEAAADQFGDVEAYVDGDRRLTFGDWWRAGRGVASLLASHGVRHGDVVALMLPACLEYAICCAAAARLGAIVTGLNPRLGPREIAAVFERAQPAVAVVDDVAAASVPAGAPVLALDAVVDAGAVADSRAPLHRGRPADPVTIVWTSGTTGLPKGAWFDHDNLRAAVTTAGVMAAPFDRRLVTTPLPHAGYMAKLWEQAAWATTLVLGPTPWTAVDTIRLLGRERITVAGGVPTQWAQIVAHPALDDTDLGTLRLCVAATAPTPPELVERVTVRFGCPLVVRYAMTESPSITGTEPGDAPEVLFRSVGRPQAGVELELRDPVEGVGRIHVRSACVMRGYWREPERTREVLDDEGWLRTGDLGRFDPHGNLVLAGRIGDMYIRGGYNVHPLEVERVLEEHEGIRQAAVVGVAAPVIGEIGCAFLVVEPGAVAPTLEDVRAWCRARLADYKAPDRVTIVDALPLTPMMKVDKQALRTLANEDD